MQSSIIANQANKQTSFMTKKKHKKNKNILTKCHNRKMQRSIIVNKANPETSTNTTKTNSQTSVVFD